MALFLNTSGGAWDNAKKYVSGGAADSEGVGAAWLLTVLGARRLLTHAQGR